MPILTAHIRLYDTNGDGVLSRFSSCLINGNVIIVSMFPPNNFSFFEGRDRRCGSIGKWPDGKASESFCWNWKKNFVENYEDLQQFFSFNHNNWFSNLCVIWLKNKQKRSRVWESDKGTFKTFKMKSKAVLWIENINYRDLNNKNFINTFKQHIIQADSA